MANLKSITELPVAESAEGLNLIVNDNGSAKQIAASAVGAQADWAETDENSPAYVKNKPAEELDLDVEVIINAPDGEGNRTHSYSINHVNTFENIKNKMVNGETLRHKVKFIEYGDDEVFWYLNVTPEIQYYIENGNEFIYFGFAGLVDYSVYLLLNPDNTVVDDT